MSRSRLKAAILLALAATSCGGSGSVPDPCAHARVTVTMDGATTVACGTVGLLHGVVFAASATARTDASSVSVQLGVPTQVGTYTLPGTNAPAAFAQVAVTAADGATYRTDGTDAQGTMTVATADGQSASGTFDFTDLGKQVTGAFTFR